ncbi:endonuclease I family protein [Amphritea sp. 1_MG-2023]|uniref:endonuclease I family protein n=1 Tax=Amphritea sp. 1_MG-2023 TaxID=3062670 RepID=UPI0026E26053|nr:endonuclease I family protein [Amphritea sp. 1_MG-2023]MDO6564592.1 endonuclease I family protein [Amphritea sp. 1_MG-2023]
MSLRLWVPLSVWLLSACMVVDAAPSFSRSKRLLATLYQQNPVSFYCGCDYQLQGKKLIPDWQSCGYTPRKNANRAGRIEWEHVVPAWAFGHQLQCWQTGGRKACKRVEAFKRMEADLHNLVPAIGEVNGDRSNYSFAALEGEPRVYGRCDMEVNFKQRKVEPPVNRQGDIARTYFYMRDQYGLHISAKQEQLFAAWHRLDPVDQWELKRNEAISTLQGNSNPYVTAPYQHRAVVAKESASQTSVSKAEAESLVQRILIKLGQL